MPLDTFFNKLFLYRDKFGRPAAVYRWKMITCVQENNNLSNIWMILIRAIIYYMTIAFVAVSMHPKTES